MPGPDETAARELRHSKRATFKAARRPGEGRAKAFMLWFVAGSILLLNLPFGYWRAGVPRLSFPWFAAVHAPVPLAIGLRYAAGLGFHWQTLPLFVAAFFGGQWLGGRLRARQHARPAPTPPSGRRSPSAAD